MQVSKSTILVTRRAANSRLKSRVCAASQTKSFHQFDNLNYSEFLKYP